MFLQFFNQSFNAVVNFSNRGSDEKAETRCRPSIGGPADLIHTYCLYCPPRIHTYRHLFLSFLIAVGTATTVAYTLPRTRLLSVGVCNYSYPSHDVCLWMGSRVCPFLFLHAGCRVMDTMNCTVRPIYCIVAFFQL